MRVVALESFVGTAVQVKKGDVCECSEKFAKELITKGIARVATVDEKKVVDAVNLASLEEASKPAPPETEPEPDQPLDETK